jgi:hypothetical protein
MNFMVFNVESQQRCSLSYKEIVMSLRHRHIGGPALTEGQAALITLFFAFVVIPFMWYFVWSPMIKWIPRELNSYIVMAGIAIYLGECFERVPLNKERALLWNGKYTGASFASGICLVPEMPFPVISFALKALLSVDVAEYLGWKLEGDTTVESLPISSQSEGLTLDGARVGFTFSAVLEVVDTSVFLLQTTNEANRNSYERAVAVSISKVLKGFVARNLAKDFMQGVYNEDLEQEITRLSGSIKEYGLTVRSITMTSIQILGREVEAAFDRVQASAILQGAADIQADNFARFFAKLKKDNPTISEEVALALFNASHGSSTNIGIFTSRNRGGE